jgi:nucleoid-associated protein EbfC
MFDMMKMLGKMKEVQAKIKEAQDNLVNISTTSESGAGMVKATVNGKKQVIKIEVDPEIFKKEDREMVQDLIVAAVNKALTDIDVQVKEEMRKATDGLIPNIPGFDMSGLFNG